jgi:hypothetical protein
LGEGGFAQPAEDAGAEEKAGCNVAGDGRQDARRGREAAARKSCQQQQPEDQEAIGGRRPRGQEIGGSQSVLMRATVLAASWIPRISIGVGGVIRGIGIREAANR